MDIQLKLLRALKTLAAAPDRDQNVRDSGNIKNMVSTIGLDKCEDLADMWFDLPANNLKPIATKAILLGRMAKQKMIVRVVFPTKHFYFIGSEADVVRKLRSYMPADQENTEDGKTKEDTEKDNK